MSDLLEEFFCCTPLRQAELDAFADRGVPPMALVQPDVLMRDVVVFDDAGRFEFKRWADGDGVGALIILARSRIGEPMDLVAWTPGDNRLAAWFGYAGLLGEDTVPLHETVRVHRSPMTWLRASRRGVVLINPARAARALQDAGSLQAEDLEHAKALKPLVTIATPKILVPAERMAA